MPKQSTALNRVFHALADPTRRSVMARLSQGPASVSDLAQPFDMALPSFVAHLRVLEQGGLIRSSKAGRVRTCELVAAPLSEAETWIAQTREYWEGHLDALARYVESSVAEQAAPKSTNKEQNHER